MEESGFVACSSPLSRWWRKEAALPHDSHTPGSMMEAGQQVDSCCVGTPDYLAPEIFLGMGHGTALLGHWEFFFFFWLFHSADPPDGAPQDPRSIGGRWDVLPTSSWSGSLHSMLIPSRQYLPTSLATVNPVHHVVEFFWHSLIMLSPSLQSPSSCFSHHLA